MGDVEFLVGPEQDPAPDDVPADDEVDLAPRRLPRWVVVTGAALAAVLVIAALVARVGSRSRHPVALASATPGTSPSRALPAPLPTSPVDGVVGEGDQIALDVALAGNILYSLRYDTLTTTDALHGRELSRVQVSGLDYFYGGPTRHLALDPTTSTAWVFTLEVAPPRLLEFDSASLRLRRRLLVPGRILGAATMGGRLYLATSAGVVEVAPGRPPRVLPGTHGDQVSSIAADPDRDRLVAIDASAPEHVLTVAPGGAVTVAATIAPVFAPVLAVADGHVWLAGSTDAGDVVTQLDPVSLLPRRTSPVSQRAGVAVSLVGGERVLWVSSGGGSQPDQLWCVDARTGAIGGYWPSVSGAVSSRAGLVFAVRGGDVVALPADPSCPG